MDYTLGLRSIRSGIGETLSTTDMWGQMASAAVYNVSVRIWETYGIEYHFPYEQVREYVEHLKWKQRSHLSKEATLEEVEIYFYNQYAHAVAEAQGPYTSNPDQLYRGDSLITMQGKIKKKRQVHGTNFRSSAIG